MHESPERGDIMTMDVNHFAPPGLNTDFTTLPGACAPGFMMMPLRGKNYKLELIAFSNGNRFGDVDCSLVNGAADYRSDQVRMLTADLGQSANIVQS